MATSEEMKKNKQMVQLTAQFSSISEICGFSQVFIGRHL